MSIYCEKLEFVKSKLNEYVTNIFKTYGNELLLRLEEYNLLSHANNCLETSTATGFILEEFITSKLEQYTSTHDGDSEIKVEKPKGLSTVNLSYDCYVHYSKVFFMINVKAEKDGSSNNALSAINILHRDYVMTDPDTEKAYVVLKANYTFKTSERDKQRKIFITGIKSYCLEEIDFSGGHKQDHRNWSEAFNPSSGRLQISAKFKKQHLLPQDKISYATTKNFIDVMFNSGVPRSDSND